MDRRIILCLLFALFLLPIVNAVPPVTTVTNLNSGVVISYPSPTTISSNQTLYVRFWVYNITDGKLLTNSTTNCTYNLLDDTGKNIIRIATPKASGINFGQLGTNACANCFNAEISAGNFSKIGYYPFQIRCQTANTGGFNDGYYEVTYSGESLTTAQSIIDGSFFLLLILFMIAILFVMQLLPDENAKSNTGEIISISLLKYLRGTLWLVEWIMLIGILYIASNLAFAYLQIGLFATIFFTLFRICLGITPIIVIVWMIWIFAKIIQDKEIKTMLSRGMFKQSF